MIQFKIISGDFLELPDDFDLQFQFNNTAFAFDSMNLSRSAEFEIPRTPKNDLIFSFGHDFAKSGDLIRRKIESELYYSGGKISGLLYVQGYTDNYNAVFVYGELVELKKLKDAGNVSGYLNLMENILVIQNNLITSYYIDGNLPSNFAFYNYENNISNPLGLKMALMPTVKLKYLLDEAIEKNGLNIDYTGLDGIDSIGLILSTNKQHGGGTPLRVAGIPNSTLDFVGGGTTFLTRTTKNFVVYPYALIRVFWHTVQCKVFVCNFDLTIKITNIPTPNNSLLERALIVTGNGNTTLKTQSPFWLVAGDTFSFKKGDYFSFTNPWDYVQMLASEDFVKYVDVEFNVYLGAEDDVDYNEYYYLTDNLPDVTATDLLKTVSNLFKSGINYDFSTKTISFFDYNFDKSLAININELVIDIKSVNRKFIDYAQKNKVNFKSESYVKAPFYFDYKIYNDNLDLDKTIYTIPFNDANRSENYSVLVEDWEIQDNNIYKNTAKTPTLAVASKNAIETKLKHISTLYVYNEVNNNFAEIVANSTTIEITVKMKAFEFLRLKNDSLFKYLSTYFCIYSGTHTGEIAEFVLIKI